MQPEVQITEKQAPKFDVLRFTGQISWEGQANGLPKEIYAFLILQNSTTEAINALVEQQSRAFISAQAMFIQREQGKIVDLHQTPQDRLLIPMHWIVTISAEVIPLIGELSLPDENGVERLSNGKEP